MGTASYILKPRSPLSWMDPGKEKKNFAENF